MLFFVIRESNRGSLLTSIRARRRVERESRVRLETGVKEE